MHPPIRIGKGAVFFGKAARGQDDVCHLSGFGHENVLDHEEIQVSEAFFTMIQIRIRDQRIFANNIKGFELAVVGRRDHIGYFQADLIR